MVIAAYITGIVSVLIMAFSLIIGPTIVGTSLLTNVVYPPIKEYVSDINIRNANGLHYSFIPGKSFKYVKDGIWGEPWENRVKFSKKKLLTFHDKIEDAVADGNIGGYEFVYKRLNLMSKIIPNEPPRHKRIRKWQHIPNILRHIISQYAGKAELKEAFYSPLDKQKYFHEYQAFEICTKYLERLELNSEKDKYDKRFIDRNFMKRLDDMILHADLVALMN